MLTEYRGIRAPLLDGAGSVYVVDEWHPAGQNFAIRLGKYAVTGGLTWERLFDFGTVDFAAALTVDAAGEVSGWSNIISGTLEEPLPLLNLGFVKFGPAAQFRGFRIHDLAPPGNVESIAAAGVDADGNVYGVGELAGQFFVVKVNTALNIDWTRTEFPGEARSVHVSAAGEVTAVGDSNGAALLVRYSSTGVRLFDQLLSSGSSAAAVLSGPGERILVAGRSDASDGLIAAYLPCEIACNDDAGDMNCDGAISVSDIGGFVAALTDPVGYVTQNPTCFLFNAELNGDEQISVGDIGPFVQLLTGG